MKKITILFLTLMISTSIIAQKKNNFSTQLYSESYFGLDLLEVKKSTQDQVFVSHKQLRQLAPNILLGQLKYNNNKYRSNLGLMYGDYSKYNLAAEPKFLKNIFEANVGIKLSKIRETWLDIGIMPSHIGYESGIGMDCPTLSRSFCAENSPYYESGAKISSNSLNKKWTWAALVLNGWQRSNFRKLENLKHLGGQVSYKYSKTLLLNYSNFIGSDEINNVITKRFYNDLYFVKDFKKDISLIGVFDFGINQVNFDNRTSWYTSSLILKKKWNEKISAAARAEYFRDKQSSLFTNLPTYAATSINGDYLLKDNILIRSELKWVNNSDNSLIWMNSFNWRLK
jgi:Putative beta-barrel porin-2, OmpL-like. bbp2